MKKIIHNIRQQPEEVKRHILHTFILFFAIILFFLWIYSLGKNFTNTDTQAKISQDLQPLSILKDSITNGFNNLK
ncbi:hypothetical protein KKG24_02135 [Patescibacteria group bacterium]|nr:hypothetical protein [Patescibacteria group bacterium]